METDVVLVERIKANDPDAFQELYQRHRDNILKTCQCILKNPEAAEDAMQEAFLLAYRKINSFEGTAQFSTWLQRIAVNASLDYLRKPHRRETSIEVENIFQHGTRDHALERSPEWKEFSKALERLTPEHQQILDLRSIMGYSYKEIAVILGCNINSCRTRHRRAIACTQRALVHSKKWRA